MSCDCCVSDCCVDVAVAVAAGVADVVVVAAVLPPLQQQHFEAIATSWPLDPNDPHQRHRSHTNQVARSSYAVRIPGKKSKPKDADFVKDTFF